MLTDDVIALINQLCPDVKNVVNDVRWTQTQPAWGVIVRQRQTTGTSNPLLKVHTQFCDLIIRGAGTGEMGRKDAYANAMRLYKALDLVFPTTVGQTHFIKITTDSSPFEVLDGDHADYQFGIQIITYYGGN